MEAYMELSKKTTILLTPRLHELLNGIAKAQKTSVGELIRRACEMQYGLVLETDSSSAVERLSDLNLPIDTPDRMKRESVLTSDEFPQ